MIQIGYKDYINRVHGCWLGKCIAGTIGAPYEGMKQLQNLSYDPSMIANMLPNDDLDLQILWLEVLEKKGVHFSSDDLAQAFFDRCPYAPGEYAIFKKNYQRGLRPPHTGAFNNPYYIEGMGCPIRSEIWACMAPGDPQLAARLAAEDGVLDHAGNSVYAEQFLAAAQALAFVEPDLDLCLDQALEVVPKDSRFYRMASDVARWYSPELPWQTVRERLLRDYGHPDCTNMFQNMGILLLAMRYGEIDFLKTTMIALNSGFDTDCTCASAGALLGIHYGATGLMNTYGFTDQRFKLGVNAKRPSDRICDLADDTARIGLLFNALNQKAKITGGPAAPLIAPAPSSPVRFEVDYMGSPAMALGEKRVVRLGCTNLTDKPMTGTLEAQAPEGWRVRIASPDQVLPPGERVCADVQVEVPSELPILYETNLLTVHFNTPGIDPPSCEIGVVGAAAWTLFGPFWKNIVEVPPLKIGESYFGHVAAGASSESATLDRVRDYHLNAFVDWDREYVSCEQAERVCRGENIGLEGIPAHTGEDRFAIGDLLGWQGPCIVYLIRRLFVPEGRTVNLQMGHSDAFRLWINGVMLAERNDPGWWTNENVHVLNVPLKKGENWVMIKLARRAEEAFFSLVFSKGGSCADHYADGGSYNPAIPPA